MTRLVYLVIILIACAMGMGCGQGDPLDKAAPAVTSTDKQPQAIPGKRPNRAPPLGGPNKGQDIFGGKTASGG